MDRTPIDKMNDKQLREEFNSRFHEAASFYRRHNVERGDNEFFGALAYLKRVSSKTPEELILIGGIEWRYYKVTIELAEQDIKKKVSLNNFMGAAYEAIEEAELAATRKDTEQVKNFGEMAIYCLEAALGNRLRDQDNITIDLPKLNITFTNELPGAPLSLSRMLRTDMTYYDIIEDYGKLAKVYEAVGLMDKSKEMTERAKVTEIEYNKWNSELKHTQQSRARDKAKST